jgi:hypothetical protein
MTFDMFDQGFGRYGLFDEALCAEISKDLLCF